jgi:hypothetical protein
MEMTKIHERPFAVLRCSISNHIKIAARSLFAELVRFEMISKPKSPHYSRAEKFDRQSCGQLFLRYRRRSAEIE